MPQRWVIDPRRSRIRFTAFKLGVIPIPGRFREIHGTLTGTGSSPVQAEASILASSITTYLPPRDIHLRGPQFLDARRYPTIFARSAAVALSDAGGAAIEAQVALEIKGHVHRVRLTGRRDLHDALMTVDVRGRVDRRDFALRPWLGFGGILIGHRIRVRAKLTFLPAPELRPSRRFGQAAGAPLSAPPAEPGASAARAGVDV